MKRMEGRGGDREGTAYEDKGEKNGRKERRKD